MNWITDKIAVASARELNENLLLQQGITHVLIVGAVTPPPFQQITVAKIPWHDEHSLTRLYQALQWIDSAVLHGKVLIVCPAGMERSPLTAVAYLIHKGYSLDYAVEHVQNQHPQSMIHISWLRDLGFL